MGSVAVLTTTWDNDSEIYPVEYFRHYLYCDQCGSFQLDHWIEPENHAQLEKHRKRFDLLAGIFFAPAAATVGIWLLWAVVLVFIGALSAVTDLLPFLLIPLGFLVPAGVFFTLAMKVEGLIQHRGLRCGQCGAEYENGSPFFTDLDHNPRSYETEQVPPADDNPHWIRGKTLESQTS